jgi:hypothetical protein
VKCLRDEFDALKSTQLFFKRHPIAESSSKNGWYYNSNMKSNFDDFAEYLRRQQSRDKSGYNPLVYFGQIYDEEISRIKQSSAQQ